ncbi:hypothetical protein [Mycolicibacterium fortuitum]|uniref:hypothetical protein n=1 Tax=Mycolicibacterium fortuitum TaxID=1766 RepID=UPI003AAC1926
MTTKGRKQHRKPWQDVLDEFIEDPGKSNGKPKAVASSASLDGTLINNLDDTLESDRATQDDAKLDRVVDYDDRGRRYEVEQAAWSPGSDRDDNPEYAQLRQKLVTAGNSVAVKLKTGRTQQIEVIEPGQIPEQVQPKPTVIDNPAAQMLDAGHGFMVDDQQSRPWKTAKRTHCAQCGGEMPKPDVSKYPCEFETPLYGCRCSGCTLRKLVSRGDARNVGNPRKYCGKSCATLADNERGRWRRAVARAAKLGTEPPPEPEDKGLKFVRRSDLRSTIEGAGHRYTASTTSALPIGVPRA